MNIPMYIPTCLMAFLVLSFTWIEENSVIENDPSIEIGKKIYTSGIGNDDQQILAVVSGRDMPGTMMACVNCHGNCGKGVSLQGVAVPDIRRAQYVERHLMDVPKYELPKKINANLKKAISLGIKHNKEKMHNLMPKYKMSIDDMNHLLAYLAVLGENEKCSKS